MFSAYLSDRQTLRRDLSASLVVFLVAVPLCLGVAVASGMPAETGLVTGIVGGLLVGVLPGSSLQVSGPAAGLTVLVFGAVKAYGPASLGAIVLAAGLLQLVLGVFKAGRWFRAISVSVVHGMLGGIGLVLVVGQTYVALGRPRAAAWRVSAAFPARWSKPPASPRRWPRPASASRRSSSWPRGASFPHAYR
ncbi:hypothetical protein GCM10029978_058860 [Actinoallomurus acanthiterrae]